MTKSKKQTEKKLKDNEKEKLNDSNIQLTSNDEEDEEIVEIK